MNIVYVVNTFKQRLLSFETTFMATPASRAGGRSATIPTHDFGIHRGIRRSRIVTGQFFHPGSTVGKRAEVGACLACLPFGCVMKKQRPGLGRAVRSVRLPCGVPAETRGALRLEGVDLSRLLALEQERRRALERRMIDLVEAEQRRIGQDLHDNVCSQLSGIECLCQALIRERSGFPGRVGRDLERVVRLLRVVMDDARLTARGLSPSGGVEHGLLAGLRNLAERTRRTQGCRCVFRSRFAAGIPGDFQAMHLYRIAQEAVSNAIRHGHARHVAIELAVRRGMVVLRVVDDGAGFAVGAAAMTGLGLMTMEVRARTLGGRLEIQPRRNGGTEVRCTVPRALAPVRKRVPG